MPTFYSLGGLSKLPTTRDQLDGWTEVFFYNPTSRPCTARITAFFENKAPVPFEQPVSVGSLQSGLIVMGTDPARAWHPEAFHDAGFWGLKFDSDTVLDIVLIQVPGQRDRMNEETTFKGGVSHLLGMDLHRQWHFADGLWLNWTAYYKGDISRAPFPFNELEYYYFLNPGPDDARVDMTLQFRNIEHCTVHLKLPAGRVLAWRNLDKISYNQPYGVKVVSSEPIAATSIRYIYGLNGFDEWGIQLHCGMMGAPGPITA